MTLSFYSRSVRKKKRHKPWPGGEEPVSNAGIAYRQGETQESYVILRQVKKTKNVGGTGNRRYMQTGRRNADRKRDEERGRNREPSVHADRTQKCGQEKRRRTWAEPGTVGTCRQDAEMIRGEKYGTYGKN